MYSLRQLSRTCLRRPEYPWLYSGETMTTGVCPLHLPSETWFLNSLPRVARRELHFGDIDQLCFNANALFDLRSDTLVCMFAHSTRAYSAKNHRNKSRTVGAH